MIDAVAYLRTSSAANVGGDSEPRQLAAIEGYARSAGYEIVAIHRDPAVSGADPIEARGGFAAMLDQIDGNGVRVVIVEDASRFARDLMVQELGIAALLHRGVRLLTATGDDLTDTTDPLRKVMRQVAGAFHEYEKARLVAKLRGARDRKSAAAGKRVEGRKAPTPIIDRCKVLRASGASLQAISTTLADEGVVTSAGKPLDLAAISRYLSGVVGGA